MNSQELEEVFSVVKVSEELLPVQVSTAGTEDSLGWEWPLEGKVAHTCCQPGQGCVGFIMLEPCVQGIFLRLSLSFSCSLLQKKSLVFITVCCSFYSKFCSPHGHSHLLRIINYLLSGWSQGLCSGHLEEEVEAEMAALSIETWALLSSDVGGPRSVKQHHKLLK